MADPIEPAPRWRTRANDVAYRFVSILLKAVCAGTWMPGTGPGMTAAGERINHD